MTWIPMDVRMLKTRTSMVMACQMRMMISIMIQLKIRIPMGTESATIPTNSLMMRMRPSTVMKTALEIIQMHSRMMQMRL